MIDIINAKKEFKKYVSNYNPENPRISLKIVHIERVAENCKKIAQNLNLSEEEIKLAELIGIFHDLGRFEQVRIADTFSDKDSSINHAEYSNKVLFEDGLIRKFIQDTKYDQIIKTAVYNHNRAKIEDGLSEKELLFSKIIRDADKLDIFYDINTSYFPAVFWYKGFEQTEINSIVMSQLERYELIHYPDIKNNADQILIFYAYAFDLYFYDSLKYIAENKYLDTFTERVKQYFKNENVHKQAEHALEVVHEYFKIKNV